MKIALGLLVGFLIGALCRWFKLPSPCPPKLEGALLILAMTSGFALTDFLLSRKS